MGVLCLQENCEMLPYWVIRLLLWNNSSKWLSFKTSEINRHLLWFLIPWFGLIYITDIKKHFHCDPWILSTFSLTLICYVPILVETVNYRTRNDRIKVDWHWHQSITFSCTYLKFKPLLLTIKIKAKKF